MVEKEPLNIVRNHMVVTYHLDTENNKGEIVIDNFDLKVQYIFKNGICFQNETPSITKRTQRMLKLLKRGFKFHLKISISTSKIF